jgi:hypothetical protein
VVVPLFGAVVVDGVVVVVVELPLAAYATVPPPRAPATVRATRPVRKRDLTGGHLLSSDVLEPSTDHLTPRP